MDDVCPICLCPIEHLTTLKVCPHKFCYSCLIKWAKSKLHCPLCKTEFTSIMHTPERGGAFISETLPPPVTSLVDTTQPDLECLTDSYFLIEVSRLLEYAEWCKRDFDASQKHRNEYSHNRINKVVLRLNQLINLLQSDQRFSPLEVLTELYQMQAIIQLLSSGRFEELAVVFPEVSENPCRRYGADDYQQFEEEEDEEVNYKNNKSKPSSPSKNNNNNNNNNKNNKKVPLTTSSRNIRQSGVSTQPRKQRKQTYQEYDY